MPAGRPAIGTPVHLRLDNELLAALDAWATDHDTSRAEAVRRLLGQALEAEAETAALAEPTPPERVRTAVAALADRSGSRWVPLRRLRAELDMNRAELDAVLLEESGERRLVLIAESNRKALREVDHEAALAIAGDAKHHVATAPVDGELLEDRVSGAVAELGTTWEGDALVQGPTTLTAVRERLADVPEANLDAAVAALAAAGRIAVDGDTVRSTT